jgi:hypothetical protein
MWKLTIETIISLFSCNARTVRAGTNAERWTVRYRGLARYTINAIRRVKSRVAVWLALLDYMTLPKV